MHPVIKFVSNIHKLSSESFKESEIPSTLSELKKFLKTKGYEDLRWSYRKTLDNYRLSFYKYGIMHEAIFISNKQDQDKYVCVDTYIGCGPAPTRTIDLLKGRTF